MLKEAPPVYYLRWLLINIVSDTKIETLIYMKYFIDTEFIEGITKPLIGKPRHFIDLVSIGIVREDGKTYYAISKEWRYKDADEWVRANVLDKLEIEADKQRKKNCQIAREALDFFGCWHDHPFWRAPEGIEVYGYFADYDWVLFCSLFGKMIGLPKGFPMYCRDLKQTMDENGLSKEWKHQYCPDPEGEHNALVDAEWNMKLYDKIKWWKQTPATVKPL